MVRSVQVPAVYVSTYVYVDSQAITSGAGEGADYFLRVMNAGGSTGKMLSHADGAFHSAPVFSSSKHNATLWF